MSIGSASAAKKPQTASKKREFNQLFDWAAEHLSIATPRTVVTALRGAKLNDYIPAFGNRIPIAQLSTFRVFTRLSEVEQIEAARAWFDSIEPGRLTFHEPAPW